MRRLRLIVVPIVTVVIVVAASCTPEQQAGIGTTIGQLITWLLWALAHPAGSL